jgi:hypothetical protein
VSRVQIQPRRLIFKGDKNPQHTFLRMGSKAGGPRRKILRRVKDLLRYFRYAKFSLLRPFLLLAADVYADRTARELWWTSQELSPAGIIVTMSLHVHISPGG